MNHTDGDTTTAAWGRAASAVALAVVALVAVMFVWEMVSTPDSGRGSDAFQKGEEAGAGKDSLVYCTDANARDYLGGLPSRPEIEDWQSGCLVAD